MYMGFMKCGISLMTIFIMCFIVPNILRLSDVFVLPSVLVWFYGFFHARNLASCNEEEIKELQDTYVWTDFIEEREVKIKNSSLRKWGAIILIVIGVSQLWDTASGLVYQLVPSYLWNTVYQVMNEIPQVVIAIVIIILGFKLIAGKKEELHEDGK